MLDERFDCVIAGGGLAGGLVALALAARRPASRVALVEADDRLGGNHTWSFHDSDVSDANRGWLAPVVAHRWSRHAVRFPGQSHELAAGYATITSSQFDAVVQARCRAAGLTVACGEEVVAVDGDVVRTASGRVFQAPVILDARGLAEGHGLAGRCGYQKFLGQELELEEDAPAELASEPTLMDVTVEQLDGFRFVYVLPFGPRQLLVEDTTTPVARPWTARSARAAGRVLRGARPARRTRDPRGGGRAAAAVLGARFGARRVAFHDRLPRRLVSPADGLLRAGRGAGGVGSRGGQRCGRRRQRTARAVAPPRRSGPVLRTVDAADVHRGFGGTTLGAARPLLPAARRHDRAVLRDGNDDARPGAPGRRPSARALSVRAALAAEVS